ncbi:MAG: HPr kinase/phosphorylase [Hyphomicrobiaceae bacterium]
MPDAPTPRSGNTLNIHATCVAIDGAAALIIGPSGSGKSDLALRCVSQPFHLLGQTVTLSLVADDRVDLTRESDTLIARPPPSLAGLIEVRGIGITTLCYRAQAPVRLVVDISPDRALARLPDPQPVQDFLGITLPVLVVRPFEASAPAKLILALQVAARSTS